MGVERGKVERRVHRVRRHIGEERNGSALGSIEWMVGEGGRRGRCMFWGFGGCRMRVVSGGGVRGGCAPTPFVVPDGDLFFSFFF